MRKPEPHVERVAKLLYADFNGGGFEWKDAGAEDRAEFREWARRLLCAAGRDGPEVCRVQLSGRSLKLPANWPEPGRQYLILDAGKARRGRG
jgi:hypothetical protein